MLIRRLTDRLRAQDWTAVTVELVVVIAGILIAFQVDAWNQSRQARAVERASIARLIEDLEADIEQAQQWQATAQERLDYVRLLERSLTDQAVVERDPTTYIRALQEAYYIISVERNRFTFDELVSTGNLAYIENREVRRQIVDYYNYPSPNFELFRANAQRDFGGVLTVDQMFLNQDRVELQFTLDEAMAARERLLDRPEAQDMLSPAAELQFTVNGRAAYLDSEARALRESLRDYLETL